MNTVDKNDLELLSFPDTEVLEFSVDILGKTLKMKCSDGYLRKDPVGYPISNVILQVTHFRALSIYEYKDENHSLIPSYEPAFALKDICEFSYSANKLVLKGFSKIRGFWTEYTIEDGKIEVSYA